MNKVRPYFQRISIFITLCLWAFWVLLFASFDPLTVVGGLLVAVLVQVAFPLPYSGFFHWLRPLPILWLVVYFLWEVVLAAWVITVQVVRVSLVRVGLIRVRPSTQDQENACGSELPQSAVVVVPLSCREDIVLAMTAAMINLIPGTIVLEVDATVPALTLHVFDLPRQGGESGVKAAVVAQEARILRCFVVREEA